MTENSLILVIDEGTTSTRAVAFDRSFNAMASAQEEVQLLFQKDGWVEQSPEEIWDRTISVCQRVIADVGGVENIAALGITNQRETTLVWDRHTGVPIAPAIIWQDRRTAEMCHALQNAGLETVVQARTGLLLDPYFSGTKLTWLMDNVAGIRARAEIGDLAFGTVDSFLIWRLTGGNVHATDVTNASRTLLWPLNTDPGAGWDKVMCDHLRIPEALLPQVRPSSGDFGTVSRHLFGKELPILSAIGDQQAALVGQGCLKPGMAKITYGTGAFLLANTGRTVPRSTNRLLGTVGYTIKGGESAFALEGAIFNAGTVVKWLRDDLGFIRDAAESERKAAQLDSNGGVYLVPAFTGLGAPHWDADARGTITGLTRAARAEHLVRAGLEATAYQTLDLLSAFEADGARVETLSVDGGMAANDWLMQFIADICDRPVRRPDFMEMTALGAAVLAGIQLEWIDSRSWSEKTPPGQTFQPTMPADHREQLLKGWNSALRRARSGD